MVDKGAPENIFAKALAERNHYLNRILLSESLRKIVVAGPGTGKTYLFKRILDGKPKSITLTFINSLVEDLSLELAGIAEVRTLHGFAKRLLGKMSGKDIRIFSKLPYVIAEDASVLLSEQIEFSRIFNQRDDSNKHLDFYRRRRTFYNDYYGHSDVIFEAITLLEKQRHLIPSYQQVVVDEFQDFNRLEVSLIDLLAERSPVLLAGDDDQALYDFKQASTEHIRRRCHDRNLGYESFELPFCSRSTRVIVGAANDVIRNATKAGLLSGRVAKRYDYFEDPEKNTVSATNPKIIYKQLYSKQIAWFIGDRIEKIAKELRKRFSVLIISPTSVQSVNIARDLKQKGFKRIEHSESRTPEPTLLDALKIFCDEPTSNLGWRIAAKSFLKKEDFENLLRKAEANGTEKLHKLISPVLKAQIKEMVSTMRKFKTSDPIETHHLPILNGMNLKMLEILKAALTEKHELADPGTVHPSIRNIHVKTTTIPSSKGLAAEYVFITHFDDRYFIGAHGASPTDRAICNFLVALTRARNKVFLISSVKQKPTFLTWIEESRIDCSG